MSEAEQVFTGPARVRMRDAFAAVQKRAYDVGDVIVIRNEGPRGAPACAMLDHRALSGRHGQEGRPHHRRPLLGATRGFASATSARGGLARSRCATATSSPRRRRARSASISPTRARGPPQKGLDAPAHSRRRRALEVRPARRPDPVQRRHPPAPGTSSVYADLDRRRAPAPPRRRQPLALAACVPPPWPGATPSRASLNVAGRVVAIAPPASASTPDSVGSGADGAFVLGTAARTAPGPTPAGRRRHDGQRLHRRLAGGRHRRQLAHDLQSLPTPAGPHRPRPQHSPSVRIQQPAGATSSASRRGLRAWPTPA